MAVNKNKKSFVIYKDWKNLVSAMNDEQAGQMFKAIFDYQTEHEACELNNPLLQGIFNTFKAAFDEDDDKYAKACEDKAKAGSKGGQAKATNAKTANENIADIANAKNNVADVAGAKTAKENVANLADNDKDNDKEHDSDNDLKDIYCRAGTTAGGETKQETKPETKGEARPSKPKKAKAGRADSEAAEVIEHLNARTGSGYRTNAKATVSVIRARLNDGFSVDDCKKVIDTKTDQWINNPDMSKYLRPETLFRASHFEGYLNECRGKPKIRGDSPPSSSEADFNRSISEAIQRQMQELPEHIYTMEEVEAMGFN